MIVLVIMSACERYISLAKDGTELSQCMIMHITKSFLLYIDTVLYFYF